MTIFHTARGGARPRWEQAINSSTRMARPQEIHSVGVTRSGSAGVPADWSTGEYAYDGAGNITAMGGESYTYDKVSRLVSSTRNGRESYTYDAFGSLIAMNGLARTTDPATNRLTEAAYDRRGNLVGWGGYAFTWDTMGRMTSMQGPGINRSMFYDANGERIVVRGGSIYTFTLRDLGQQVQREVSSSSATGWKWGKDYIYRDGVLLASQSTSAGEGLRYHFPDHLTSPRLLTNRCGERGVEHRLSSFGVDVLSGSSQSADRMRLAMHERDLGQLSTTLDDLDLMHARTYWPSLGRFISVDPAGVSAFGRSQVWNRYSYALGNPGKYVDPSGLAVVLVYNTQAKKYQFALDADDNGLADDLEMMEVESIFVSRSSATVTVSFVGVAETFVTPARVAPPASSDAPAPGHTLYIISWRPDYTTDYWANTRTPWSLDFKNPFGAHTAILSLAKGRYHNPWGSYLHGTSGPMLGDPGDTTFLEPRFEGAGCTRVNNAVIEALRDSAAVGTPVEFIK